MLSLTTRELRVIAAILDGLNKARAFNARMGVHVTPNVFTARFPTGHTFVVRWTAGVESTDPGRRRAIEQAARHRDGYQIDLAAQPDWEKVVKLANPQPGKKAKRTGGTEIRIEGRTDPEAIQETLRTLRGEHGPQSLHWTGRETTRPPNRQG